MSKARLNVTVDPWIKEELDRRDDINVSGVVNTFLAEYLAGTDMDKAAMELRIKRLKEEEERHQEKAQRKRSEWQQLKDELNREHPRRDEMMRKVRKVPKDTDHPVVERASEELGLDPETVIQEAYDERN